MAIHNWITALSFIQRGRNYAARTIPGIRSTSVVMRDPDGIAVRYHETDVVTYHRVGWNDEEYVTLNSGGWRTVTTKARMNEYGPVPIWQRDGLWYVGGRVPGPDTGALFFDGIQIGPTGTILNPRPVAERSQVENAKRKIDRLVSAYIRGYIAECRARGALPMPGPGDCWYCLLVTSDGAAMPWGDVTGDVGHILSHLQESYYVPALLYNAVKDRGYGAGPGPIYAMANADIERGRSGDLWAISASLRAYFHKRKIALVDAFRDGEGNQDRHAFRDGEGADNAGR